MNLEHCKYLIEIHKTGSINQAARNLYTSSQNISRIKNNLEKTLDTKLFERSPGGLVPTKNGKVVLKFCQNVLSEYHQTIRQLNQNRQSSHIKGTVSVRTTTYVMEAFLNHLLLDFKTSYPFVTLKLQECETHAGCCSLLDHPNELGIFPLEMLPKEAKNLHSQYLTDLTLGIVVSHNHPLAEQKHVSLAALKKSQTPLILYTQSELPESDIFRVLSPAGIKNLVYDLTTNNNFFCQAIHSGLYAGFVCTNRYNKSFRRKHRVSVLTIDDLKTDYHLGILHRASQKGLSECEKLFISFLKENMT